MNLPLNIDFQQILLHLLNFSLLAGGLYLLLYKPVKDFIEKRQAYFQNLEADADAKLKEADEKLASGKAELQKERDELKAQKTKILMDAEDEARERLEKAKAQGNEIVTGARISAQRTIEKAEADAQVRIKELTSAAVEKLVLRSTRDAYEQFLNSAEEVERHGRQK